MINKPRVLVLGSSGLLGNAIFEHLKSIENFEVFGTGRFKTGLIHMQAKKSQILSVINEINPDYIINCIANLGREKNFQTIIRLFKINFLFSRNLHKITNKHKIFLITFSSNSVFHGNKGDYLESDKKFPKSIYGFSKLLGESQSNRTLLIRTSFIGHSNYDKDNSVVTRIINSPVNSTYYAFGNHLWNGVSVNILARLCSGIIQNSANICGILHFHTSDKISKYELTKLIATKLSRLDLNIIKVNSKNPVDLTLASVSNARHEKLWELAGFRSPITVFDVVDHYL